MGEKRKSQRQQFECPLQIRAISMDGVSYMHNSFSNNMSMIGIGLTSFDFFAVNEKVHLTILSNTLTGLVEIMGKVIWVKEMAFQDRFRIGIEFVDRSEDLSRKLRKIMNSDILCSWENNYEG